MTRSAGNIWSLQILDQQLQLDNKLRAGWGSCWMVENTPDEHSLSIGGALKICKMSSLNTFLFFSPFNLDSICDSPALVTLHLCSPPSPAVWAHTDFQVSGSSNLRLLTKIVLNLADKMHFNET